MKRVMLLSVHTCPLGHLGTRDTGGMNVYVRELSREIARNGIQVDVFTRYRNCDHDCIVELAPGARLVHLGAGEAPDLSKYDLYQYMPEFASNVMHFQQSNGLRYDAIHSHYWLSGWVAEILKAAWDVPHLTTFHTLGRAKNEMLGPNTEPGLRLSTEDRVVRNADRVLALTETERDILIGLYGVRSEKIAVIPAGVDLDVFHPQDKSEARAVLGLPEGASIVLYVGRIEPLKGVDVLLRAIAMLPSDRPVYCLIVGGNAMGDSDGTDLGSLAVELGIAGQLRFVGPVEHEELPIYYNAADVSVVPSRYESFGLVALESLACGTPVIASRVGGLPSIVRHGENGLLVPEPTPELFAQDMRQLLANEPLRLRMAQGAAESARRFAWPGIRDRVLEFYRETEALIAI
ncbi:MAG: glycosyltransferase [Chloroflexi bacterium]|nr:glycosyltransferase [Chloroflexota bacterium]